MKKSKTTKKYVFTPPVNKLYPGRPNYTGPNQGWFAFVHHSTLAEYSFCINERVKYVKGHKPKDEKPGRLADMMYLGKDLGAFIERHTVRNINVRRAILQYINAHNPNNCWRDDPHWGTLVVVNKDQCEKMHG